MLKFKFNSNHILRDCQSVTRINNVWSRSGVHRRYGYSGYFAQPYLTTIRDGKQTCLGLIGTQFDSVIFWYLFRLGNVFAVLTG